MVPDLFPEPASFSLAEKAIKVPGLDGSGKMGKSEGNCIYLMDDAKTISKKVMKAVTDAGPTVPNSEKPEVIQNLFTFLDIVSTKDTYDYFNEKYNDLFYPLRRFERNNLLQISWLTQNLSAKRLWNILQTLNILLRLLNKVQKRAQESAAKTLKEVREIIGFREI